MINIYDTDTGGRIAGTGKQNMLEFKNENKQN